MRSSSSNGDSRLLPTVIAAIVHASTAVFCRGYNMGICVSVCAFSCAFEMSDIRGFHRAVPSDAADGTAGGAPISAGAIAGTVCAVVVVVGLLAPLVYWLYRRKLKAAASPPLRPPAAAATPLVRAQEAGAAVGGQGDYTRRRAQVAVPARDGGDLCCGMCGSAYDIVRGGGELPETLECGHHFHRRCVQRWLRVNLACPTCNATHIQLCGDDDDGVQHLSLFILFLARESWLIIIFPLQQVKRPRPGIG